MKQSVLSYLAEVVGGQDRLTYENVERNKPKIQSFLRGLKIIYEIPHILKRTYRIIELCTQTSNSEFIQKSDNNKEQKITIKQYFLNSKRYNIKNANLHTLHVNTRADGNKILLPIEVCKLLKYV